AGMDGVATGTARDVDELVDAKIAFARGCGADRVSLVGEADVQGGAVHFAVNADRGNVQFAAGAEDADGDFTAIGNQDFTEHRSLSSKANSIMRGSGSQDCASLACRKPRGV